MLFYFHFYVFNHSHTHSLIRLFINLWWLCSLPSVDTINNAKNYIKILQNILKKKINKNIQNVFVPQNKELGFFRIMWNSVKSLKIWIPYNNFTWNMRDNSSQVTEYFHHYGKGVLLRQLKENQTFPLNDLYMIKTALLKGWKFYF